VVLNLPDELGIHLVAANIQARQTTQSLIVPRQRIAPIVLGQTLNTVDPLYGRFEWTDYRTRPCNRKSCDFKW
jgi:hypothetical protein